MRVMEALTKLVVGASKFGDHLLSRKVSGTVVAALAFACGAGLAHAPKGEAPPKRVAPAAAPAGCPPPATYSLPAPAADHVPADEGPGDSPELEEWKNRHGGAQLALDYDSTRYWDDLPHSKVVVLPSGRTLAAAGDGLYMLGADRRVIWKYPVPQWAADFAYVEATGLVYVTAGESSMYILDAETGRELHRQSRPGGGGGFGRVLPYGEDGCLVLDEMGGSRAGFDGGPPPTQDGVTAWRGTRMLWRRDVPPGAELQVVGSKVYAVTKTQTRILVKEIKVPKR